MPILELQKIELEQPELVFGLVAAVGTPIDHFTTLFKADLETRRGYSVNTIHCSGFMKGINLEGPFPSADASEFDRIDRLMDLGNELRQKTGGGEALALLTIAHINAQRPSTGEQHRPAQAYVLRQLKHPDEVVWLRRIYRSACQVVALYCPRSVRKKYLKVEKGMSEAQAEKLIERDQGEDQSWGQQLRSTFHRADVFIEVRAFSQDDKYLQAQVSRYLDLLFGTGVISPHSAEYGMALAATAAVRSLDLSRQVGAAILRDNNEVVGLGTNEVPAPGGGQYSDPTNDFRDHKLGRDSNETMKQEILEEILSKTDATWDELNNDQRKARLIEVSLKLRDARVMNLTEFGRAVHAEMEAILSAARIGASPEGCTLYTTTFPCHNCAKHIIGAGILKVVYIEPYPKGLAGRLHEDAILVEEDSDDSNDTRKVKFAPFLGIAPRSYYRLFSCMTEEGIRLSRKDDSGYFKENALGLRFKEPSLSYIGRETEAALAAKMILETPNKA